MPQPTKTAKDVFLIALDAEPADRAAVLDVECAEDAGLRRQVEALLRVHDEPDSVLDRPRIDLGISGIAIPDPSPTIDCPVTEKPDAVIGRYKLLEQIGEGGFGVVFMAEQEKPVRRKVALKVIKPGMDSKEVIARFEAERQALAIMDHPNVAKVFDAGATESGRPYFVMELVKGVPITEYSDTCNLSANERLELFVDACQAVQHAHQKGIIHRDIKPSNVLVAMQDGRPQPKIIDFGVAKAMNQRLTEQTVVTGFAQMVGTPLYMSPEQAEMSALDVDTRTDVYSLGVLLYELLTSTTPFERERLKSASYDEMRRIIREEEPAKPSDRISTLQNALSTVAEHRRTDPRQLQKSLRGDLDWIAMKALEKDRTRRYETVNGLAADVRRYLNDEPVEASPPSTVYRFKKFARRNKGLLTAATAIALLLLAAAVISTLAAVKFDKLADEKAALAGNLKGALGDAEKNLELAGEQEKQAKRNLQLASAEQQRAEGNLDLAMAALDAVYLDAIGRDKLLGEPVAKPGNVESHKPAERMPLTKLERDLLKRGLKFYDRFAAQNTATPRVFVQTAQAYYRVALLQTGLGDTDSAETAYRAAIERFEKLTIERPDDWIGFRHLAQAKNGLAFVLQDWSDSKTQWTAAIRAYTRAIELRPENADLWFRRSLLHSLLGDFVAGAADLEKSLQFDQDKVQYLRSALGRYKEESKFSPEYVAKTRDVLERLAALAGEDSDAHLSLGGAYQHPLHDRENSLKHFNLAVELSPNSALPLSRRAAMYGQFGERERALADANRAIEIDPSCAPAYTVRGLAYQELGLPERALVEFSRSIELGPQGHIFEWRGALLLTLKDYEGALDDFNRAVERMPRYPYVRKRRARALVHLGRYAEALADLKQALERNPKDTSTLVWIPPALVAKCPDESFRKGLLELAAKAVELSPAPANAIRDRATLYLGLGEWKKGRADLEKAVESETAGHYTHYLHALLCLTMDEAPQYRDACALMLGKFGETEDLATANFVAWACALAPDAVEDYEPAIALAEQAVDAQPHNDHFLKTLGATLFRAGRQDEAIDRLEEAERRRDAAKEGTAKSSPAYTWYFQAMAHHTAGDAEQAKDYLNKANQWTDDVLADEQSPPAWNRQATLELLRNEAETLLESGDAETTEDDQELKSKTNGQVETVQEQD